jgi:hypothetical protein
VIQNQISFFEFWYWALVLGRIEIISLILERQWHRQTEWVLAKKALNALRYINRYGGADGKKLMQDTRFVRLLSINSGSNVRGFISYHGSEQPEIKEELEQMLRLVRNPHKVAQAENECCVIL